MFYVYVLKSKVNGDIYVGYTDDLRVRLKAHNKGRVRSTNAYRPWFLVYYEAYRNKSDATKREKQLKLHRAKEELKKHIRDSLNLIVA